MLDFMCVRSGVQRISPDILAQLHNVTSAARDVPPTDGHHCTEQCTPSPIDILQLLIGCILGFSISQLLPSRLLCRRPSTPSTPSHTSRLQDYTDVENPIRTASGMEKYE